MFWILISLLFLLLGGGYLSAFFMMGRRQKQSEIYIDLGLAGKWSGEGTTAFYKWGWRKTSSERVWSERIVRKAFEKSRVWLSPEDLVFFEHKCREYEEGKPVSEDAIRTRVDAIMKRTEYISNCAAKFVREVIQYIMAVTPSEAEMILHNMGIKGEVEDPLQRLTKYELRRKLRQSGLQVLGIESNGLLIENEKGDPVSKLIGLDGWDQWMRAFKQECVNQLTRKVYPPYNTVFSSVKNSANAGLFKDYESDLNDSRKFLFQMENDIENKEIQFRLEEFERLEQILYTWQFQDNTQFNIVDHKRLREFVARKDMSTRFREILIQNLKPEMDSLYAAVNLFPRHVFFYGISQRARAFLSEQYISHLERFLDVLPRIRGWETRPPALIRIRDNDVEAYRNYTGQEPGNSRGYPFSAGRKPPSLLDLLDLEKQRSIVERSLTPEVAEQQGWIVNLGIGDLTEEDLSQLNERPYRSYIRFLSDAPGDIDFESNAYSAKQQRILFFNMMLDSLTGIPAISTQSTAEKLEAELSYAKP